MAAIQPVLADLFASLLWWFGDADWPRHNPGDDSYGTVESPQRLYTLQRLLAVGDVSDTYVGSADDDPTTGARAHYLLKVSRVAEGCALLDNERRTLATLLAAAGATTYRKYLPELVESFPAMDRFPKRVNVFRFESGLSTLEAVHQRHPALEGRHLAWIFKRLLTILGFCHRQDVVHGAVLPVHVLVHAASHGLRLVGWGHRVATGQRLQTISTRYRDWYPAEVHNKQAAVPATDLFLVARCLVYLAGGDPVSNRMPDALPIPMQRFFHSCLLEEAQMRPPDLWALQEEFDELLGQLYGPPKFYPLIMT